VALSRSQGVAAAGLGVALAFGIGATPMVPPASDALVSVSTLTVVDGAVFISHGNGDFTPARESDVLSAGDTVRTGPGSMAEITFVDGSSLRIEGGAELVVERLRRSEGDAAQRFGRAWHVVKELFTGDSRYELLTPSSTASVRG